MDEDSQRLEISIKILTKNRGEIMGGEIEREGIGHRKRGGREKGEGRYRWGERMKLG